MIAPSESIGLTAPAAVSAASTGCSCGSGADCATGASEGFVRPQFFAGQLLTEDDLLALTSSRRPRRCSFRQALFFGGVCRWPT